MKSAQAIRRMLVIVCLVAPLSVPGISSASTISGTNCRKEGRLRQVGDAKFVCTRGKKGKLRWRLQTATPTGDPKSTMKPNGTTPSKATNTTTNTTTSTTTKTAPSTAKRPGKQPPAAPTETATPTGDPNRIIENGYINLDGVRVSAVNIRNDGRELYEKCGLRGSPAVRLWFKYANGVINDERLIIYGDQVVVIRNDRWKNLAWRPVYIEASGLDPYGDVWTEENGFEPTEWIWCANRAPINP